MKARTLVVILILIGQLTISSIDSWDESKEPLSDSEELIFTTGGSNGADADLVGIISPKETVCNPTCRNVIYAGDATTFEVYIQNSGDQPLTEMGYKVQVWIPDGNGNPIMLAKDPSGADLQWDNPDVICDDASICNYQSLAAGSVLGGGNTNIQYGGGDVTWIPAPGVYVIEVETYSDADVDPGNDHQQVYVEVVDYLDIEVDIEWDDGSTVASGSGAQAFTVSVELGGSTDYTTHNLTMEIDVNGDVSQATASDGTDLLTASVGSLVHSVNVGQDQTVVVFQNETDSADSISEVRTVFSSNVNNGVWTYSGTISPDTSVSNPIYSIDVALGEYTLFGQFESCISGTIDIYSHYCEETFTTDTFTDDNSDSIIGAYGVLDNIALTSLDVFMGYNSDGTGVATSSYKYGSPQTLDVGIAYIDATVEHQGSSLTTLYDWSVKFTITNADTGEIITATETSCLQGVDPSYSYAKLGVGSNAYVSGHACTFVEFDVATYSVEAELIMGGSKTDQFLSNNELTYEFVVENRLPVIRSLELKNEEKLIVGMESLLQIEVSVFDANDVTGDGLTYTWVGGSSSTPLGCGGIGDWGRTCNTPILQDFVTNFPVVVTVTDVHGGEVSQEIVLEIWNDVIATDTTSAGIRLDYKLSYFAHSTFEIQSLNDWNTDSCSSIKLPDGEGATYAGEYTPIAIIDYVPSMSFNANDVLTQQIDITFDRSLGATSLWYTTDCQSPELTTLLSDEPFNSDELTKSTLSFGSLVSFICANLNELPRAYIEDGYNDCGDNSDEEFICDDGTILPPDWVNDGEKDCTNGDDETTDKLNIAGPSFPSGQFLLIGNPLTESVPPNAALSSFNLESRGDGLYLMWGTTGTFTQGDFIKVTITNTETMQDFVTELPTNQMQYLHSDVVGDVTYEVKVEVCNQAQLCSTPIGSGTVVGTAVFDAYAVNVSVQLAEDQFSGPVYEIAWDVSGDSQLVQNWMICGMLLEPSLQYEGTCYTTSEQGTLEEPHRFTNRIPDQYSEVNVEAFFTVIAVDSTGINSFKFSDENSNSIGSIVYDKSDYRPGKWGQEVFSSIDCDYEFSSDTHLICNDGGRLTGGDIFLQKDQTLTLGGEWDVVTDQRIGSQDQVSGDSALNLINFTNMGSSNILNISCFDLCLFRDSDITQHYSYEFGLFADIIVDNTSFDFKSNPLNRPHFVTEIYRSPYYPIMGFGGETPKIPSSISELDQTYIYSVENKSEYTSESIWGLYLRQDYFEFCIESPEDEDDENRDRALDLQLLFESIESQGEELFLTISDKNSTVKRFELRENPSLMTFPDLLCLRHYNDNSQDIPVLLSLYNLSGGSYNRTIYLEYHPNNSWGTDIQLIPLTERYFELTMPYVVMSTHSIDQVKHFSSSKFESFVRIENPTQFDYEIDLECIATKENKVVYNNQTKVIPANQTLLQVIEWSLEHSGQYELSCNAPTHPYYPDQFIGEDGEWNQDNTSEVAFVIIEKQPEEGFLGSNSIITYSLAGIGSLVCAVIVLLVVRRFRSDEDEEDEEEDEYEYDYNQYSNDQTPSMVNLPLGGGYDESEGATVPPYSFEGFINEDGYEVCEYPVGSGDWFWKNHETQEWVFWE